ncbi:MAG: membrane protease YdiL (CAAX protease family) [Rhodothermales bacterium]
MAGLVIGFAAFQGISLLVFLGSVAASGGLAALTQLDPGDLVETYARELLIGNTVGQFLGLALLAWFLARLHTSRPAEMLRLRKSEVGLTALSLLGWVALFPIVQWAGVAMDALPWPDAIREFEQLQIDLIERVLDKDLGLVFTLIAMAATPAICEEIFFRGYIQRQSERLFRTWLPAVLFTGVVFGLYHMRLTQAVPLSMLGVYMAYVVWRSDSLLPGMLVHLANNGFAVALGAYVAGSDTISLQDLESMEIPGYIVLVSVAVFGIVLRAIHQRGHAASKSL